MASIPGIIGAIAFALSFVVFLFIGLFFRQPEKPHAKATQQLRWIFNLLSLLVHFVGWLAIALDQTMLTRSDGVLITWAVHALQAASHWAIAAVLVLGLFETLGARLLTPIVTLLMGIAFAIGAFGPGFDHWFW